MLSTQTFYFMHMQRSFFLYVCVRYKFVCRGVYVWFLSIHVCEYLIVYLFRGQRMPSVLFFCPLPLSLETGYVTEPRATPAASDPVCGLAGTRMLPFPGGDMIQGSVFLCQVDPEKISSMVLLS